jgi:16S rRNA (cytidine1402-2'-O)-methyltransferase
VRRTAGESDAATVISSNRMGGRGQRNPRPKRSKPEAALPGSPANAAGELPPAGASSESGLAPGLYLVATPIGNLNDITLRALAVLRSADRIFCEDTRVSKKLLARYGIAKPLETYHDHNAEEVRPVILEALRRGARVALISDAGTPLVSDPGFRLVRATLGEHLPVTAAPGPSAALTALILSGLPPDAFLFAGFLPPRQAMRRRTLERWAAVDATLLFFESARRLAESLKDMIVVFGNRPAAVARELTKLHEEVRRGRLAELADHYRKAGPPRGEAVIVVGQPERREPASVEVDARMRSALGDLSIRDAVAKLAHETGLPRNELYRRALAIREGKQ